MRKIVLFTALLALAVSAKAGSMSELESAAGGGIGDNSAAIPQVAAPAESETGGDRDIGDFIDNIIDQIPFKRTYRLGPLFKLEADNALPGIIRNFENAEAKIQESHVEGGWRDSYVVVVYKAGFRVKQDRRDHISGGIYAYYLRDRILDELQRQGAHVIYSRIEGLPGDFSIITDYAGNDGNVPQIIDGVINGGAPQPR